ncbi:MAG: PQQ-binding-like beta-propeller repeat protein [Halanaeroarchaeum sp.]
MWRTSVGGTVEGSSPTVVDDRIYVGVAGNETVVAMNASSQKVVWNASLGARVYGSPAVDDGTVYVGDDTGTVHALNAATGNTTWTKTPGGEIVSSIGAANDTVIVTSTDGTANAYNATSGDLYWSYDVGVPITSSPAILNATVYVGVDDPTGDEVIALGGDVAAPSMIRFAGAIERRNRPIQTGKRTTGAVGVDGVVPR